MALFVTVLIGIGVAGIILALTSRQPYTKPRRLSRIFLNVFANVQDPRFRAPYVNPREVVGNLNREIEETRRRAYRSSHRSRPR